MGYPLGGEVAVLDADGSLAAVGEVGESSVAGTWSCPATGTTPTPPQPRWSTAGCTGDLGSLRRPRLPDAARPVGTWSSAVGATSIRGRSEEVLLTHPRVEGVCGRGARPGLGRGRRRVRSGSAGSDRWTSTCSSALPSSSGPSGTSSSTSELPRAATAKDAQANYGTSSQPATQSLPGGRVCTAPRGVSRYRADARR